MLLTLIAKIMKISSKHCTICHKWLPKTTKYFSHARTENDYKSACKECTAEKKRKIYNEKKLLADPIVRVKKSNEYLSLKEQFAAEKKEYSNRGTKTKEEIRNRRNLLQKKYSAELTNAKVAKSLRLPVSQIDLTVLSCARKIIMLKRMTGQTHSSKRELNINNQYQKQWMQQSRML